MPIRRRALVAAALGAIALASPPATAAERDEDDDQPVDVRAQPRLPAPLVLPELAHPRTDASLTWTVGQGSPRAPGASNAALALARARIEGSLFARRRVYGGVTYAYAGALSPDPAARGARVALGNVEPHVRAVFPLTSGLALGFVLGIVLPTSTIGREDAAQSAMLAAASLEPTELAHFLAQRFAIRPAGDLRIVRGPFVLQLRQGVDFLIDREGIDEARAAGRILGHVGFAPTRSLEVSLEASQLYFFSGAASEYYQVADDQRAAFTAGPSLRLSFPDVDVGAGVVTNLSAPLSPMLDSFVAARFSVVAHFR